MELCKHYALMLKPAGCIHPAEDCIFHADVCGLGRHAALFYSYIEHLRGNRNCQKEIEIDEKTLDFWWGLLQKELQKEEVES